MTEFNHHGIEGQKWGIQNGPPYPLSSYLSTGKSLRKAARKEAKYGSKEYKQAKELAKNTKAKRNLARDRLVNYIDEGASPSTVRLLKNDYKSSKIEYKQAKTELSRAKSNTEAAKDVLKKVDKMSLDEVEQFLKDRGYTTKSISKLAMKDYKKETKQAEKNRRPHITENEKKANDELMSTVNKIRDARIKRDGYGPSLGREKDFTKSELREYAKASMKYANDTNLYEKKYTNLDDYLLDVTNQRGDAALYSLWGDLIEYM